MMKIPLSAPDIEEWEVERVAEVLRSGRLSLGPKLSEFERAVSTYVGAADGVAVNSGTSGLHLAVRALGLGPGDEVITSPFSFIAPANAILYERATPVFVDIDAVSLNIDPERIEAAVTPRTRALMIVHTFGRPAAMSAITDIARRHKLLVIEDACEAIGAETGGRKVGAIGDAGVFAFYPNKQLTTGEGGMVLTNDAERAARMRSLRNQGRAQSADWCEHRELGFNYRLPEMSCALGLSQLARVEAILNRREAVARAYSRRLSAEPDLILPETEITAGRVSWFVYVVRLSDRFGREDRDWVASRLQARGIGCARYFAPIHLQPFYRESFGHRAGAFPVTERVAARTLALPFYNRMTDEALDEVSRTLLELIDVRRKAL
jgi:perosamine synthetase